MSSKRLNKTMVCTSVVVHVWKCPSASVLASNGQCPEFPTVPPLAWLSSAPPGTPADLPVDQQLYVMPSTMEGQGGCKTHSVLRPMFVLIGRLSVLCQLLKICSFSWRLITLKIKLPVLLLANMGLLRNSRELHSRTSNYIKTVGKSRKQRRRTLFYRGSGKVEGLL